MEKKQFNPKVQWAKFAAATVAYLLFLLWVKSWWGLVVLPFIFDVYITKKIRWQWWRDSENRLVAAVMPWVDALVFALVAVYFINIYFFQNYVIPSSSLEKSLLVGDYLFVSKVSYGPRKPQTPLTLPLTQHTLPVFDCDSYIEWPQWGYERAKGFGKVTAIFGSVYNHVTGYFGDILSYSRLMTLMLAGSVIASVFNTLGATFGNVVLFVIVSLIGNALNLALNLLGCYVHDLRLQCLEFFNRFYQEGGKPYRPLTIQPKYVDMIKEEQ